GLLPLEVVETERHHVMEHALAEILEETLPDLRQLPDRESGEQQRDTREDQISGACDIHCADVMLGNTRVDGVRDEPGTRKQCEGLHDERNKEPIEPRMPRPQHPPETTGNLPRLEPRELLGCHHESHDAPFPAADGTDVAARSRAAVANTSRYRSLVARS